MRLQGLRYDPRKTADALQFLGYLVEHVEGKQQTEKIIFFSSQLRLLY